MSFDHLADSDDPRAFIRAFIDAMSDITGASSSIVSGATAVALERALRRRSDDIGEVLRLGRLLQALRVESEQKR